MTTKVTTQEPRATASEYVQAKALDYYNAGKVSLLRKDSLSATYLVRSDGGNYTVLQNHENIDADRCTCAWNRYQPFNVAVCSHILAARYEKTLPQPKWRKMLLRIAERIGC